MGETNKTVSTETGTRLQFSALIEKQPHLFLLAILFIALILRVIALLSLKESIYFDSLLWDERLYHTWASKIANGTYASSAIYEASPLPAYVVAFIYKLFVPDPTYFRILNIGFGVLTCYLVYLIANELAGRKVGLAACLLACIYKPFIFYSIVPLNTSMAVFFFAFTLYLFLVSYERTSLLLNFFLGVAAGFLFNVRPNSVVLIPIMPLLIFLALRKRGTPTRAITATLALYAAGLCLSLSPFVVRNYRATGELAVAPSQSGFNLYIGNNLANPDPYYRPVPFASSSPYVQGIHFTVEASRRAGKKLSPQEASWYWTSEVLRMAWENPGAFLRKLWLKTLVLFNQFEACDHYHIGFMAKFMPFLNIPFPSLWLILPLGLAGLSVSLLESRKSLALGLILFAYSATLVVFFCNTRYRLPLSSGLIPLAIVGFERLYFFTRIRNWNRVALYVFIATAFSVIEFLPVKATGDLTAYYNTHAVVLSKRSPEEASQYWEKSSQMEKSFSPFANIGLAGYYLNKKEIDKALLYLNKVTEDSFAASHKYEKLGDILMARAQPEKAISAYMRSLEINSAQLRIHQKLIKIYSGTDSDKAKAIQKQLEHTQSFYKSSFW